MKQLAGKSLREHLEYWQKGTEDLKKLQQKLKEKSRCRQHCSTDFPMLKIRGMPLKDGDQALRFSCEREGRVEQRKGQ